MQLKRFHRPEVGVFIASVLVIVLFWMILPPGLERNENSDYLEFYEPVARSVLQGEGFTHPDGTPALRYPPGYPLLLAGVFGLCSLSRVPEVALLSALILVGMGLSSVFVYMLARSIWGPIPALAAVLGWITYPPFLWLTKQPNSEVPFVAIFFGGFYLFCRSVLQKQPPWFIYFLSGLLIGFAMLIRPIAIGAVLVMGIILWGLKRETAWASRIFLITLMLVGNLVAIFPWETWAYIRTGRVIFLSSGAIPSVIDGLTFAVMPKGYRERVDVAPEVAALMQDIQAASSTSEEVKSVGGIIPLLIEKLRSEPVGMLKILALKVARSWYATDSGRFETPLLSVQIVYLVFVLWGGIVAWGQGNISRRLVVAIWLMVLYFWVMTTMVLSILRYMVPAMGLLFVFIPGAFVKSAR